MKTKKRIVLACLVVLCLVVLGLAVSGSVQKRVSGGIANPISVQLPAWEIISDVAYLEDQEVLIIGGAGTGTTYVIRDGQIISTIKETVCNSSTLGGTTIAFIGGQKLVRLAVTGDQLTATPTDLPSRMNFTALPDGHLASLDILGFLDQLEEITEQIEQVLVTAGRNGGRISEELLPTLTESGSALSQLEWRKIIQFAKEYENKKVGVDELSRLIKPEQLLVVRVYNAQGEEVAQCLHPPSVEGANIMKCRYAGWWSNGWLYVVNTYEPKLYVLGFDPAGTNGQILWLEKEIDFLVHLQEIGQEFNYRPPPVADFTPVLSVHALENQVVVRVWDKEIGKSALLVFQDDNYIGSVVTELSPVHSSGSKLVAMKGNNTYYLLSSPLELLQMK